SSRRRHTSSYGDWSSDVCSSDLGFALDVAIARALDLTPFEAEPIKRALSASADGPAPDGLTEEPAAKAREALRAQLDLFARELRSEERRVGKERGARWAGTPWTR